MGSERAQRRPGAQTESAPELSADLFSLSKRASFGRVAEIHAMAGGYGEAGASVRRGFNVNAELGLSAGAGGSVQKFVAATLDLKAAAQAGIRAQAQFPLDFFTESGAICRLSAAVSAGVYGSLSVGLPLEEFRRAFVGSQATLARGLGEIFLDEVTVEAGVWAKAAVSAEASVKCVVAGSLLPDPRGRRKPGFTASFEWGLGLLYGTGMSAFARLGFRDPRRLVARTAEELTAVVLEMIERQAGRGPSPTVPYVRMLLPLALRAGYELGVLAAQTKGGEARREARTRFFALARSEATAFASELLVAAGLGRMRRLFEDPKIKTAVAALNGEAAGRARRALEDFQAAIPRRPSLTSVPRLVGPFLEFGALVRPANLDEWTDTAATVWAALAILSDTRTAAGAPAGAAPDPGARVRGHVNRAIGKPADSKLDAAAASRFLIDRRALDAAAAALPDVRPAVDWLRGLFAAGEPGSLGAVLFGPADDRREIGEGAWVALKNGLKQAARERLDAEVLSVLGRVADPEGREFANEVVRPALLSLGDVVLDGVDKLGSAEGRLVFREQVSLLLLQVVGRNAVVCADILIARALSESARGMRGLAGTLKGQRGDAFTRFAAATLDFGGSPKQKLVEILELGAALAELWDDKERGRLRTSLLGMMELLGPRQDPGSVWRQVERSKSFLPNLKRLQAFVKHTAVQIGRLIVKALWLYFKQLFKNVLAAIKTIARTIWEAAKKWLRTLESAVKTLTKAIRDLVGAIRNLKQTIKNLGREVGRQLAAIKQRLRSRAFRDQAVGALRSLGEKGLAGLVRAHPVYRALPNVLGARKKALDLARGAYRGVFDKLVAPLVRLALQGLGELSGLIPESRGVGPEAAPARIEAAVRDGTTGSIRRVLARQRQLSIGVRVLKKNIGIKLPLPTDQMARALAGLVGADHGVQAAVRAGADAKRRTSAANRDLKTTSAREQRAQGDLRKAEGRWAGTRAGRLDLKLVSPADGEVQSGTAVLEGVVRGANETFISPGRHGARRVTAVLDQKPIPFQRQDWHWDPARKELRFRRSLTATTGKAEGHTFSLVATDGHSEPLSAGVAFGLVPR